MNDFPVFVYRNLKRGGWSVRSKAGETGGRVIAHANLVKLDHAVFHVSEAGRQRVLKSGQKNVHAGISGYLKGLVGTLTSYGQEITDQLEWAMQGGEPIPEGRMSEISYSPFLGKNFFALDDWEPAMESRHVLFTDESKVFASRPINVEKLRPAG